MSESYHFVGIGGAGMSALARILAAKGERVTGSDMAESSTLSALRAEFGIDASAGHSAANINGATRVIVSAAIKEDNPEVVAAKKAGLGTLSRSQMLGELMGLYHTSIAVAGTHGKTTTSAMIAQMLEYADCDPTALIGGDVPAWHSNARLGHTDVFVAEACEAYGSFLDMRSFISVVTNIEADHLDYYADLDDIMDAFRRFLSRSARKYLCVDDPNCRKLASEFEGVTTYGFSDTAMARGIPDPGHPGKFSVLYRGSEQGEITLSVPGRHNMLNALAAVAVGLEVPIPEALKDGLPFSEIAKGLAKFSGTGRRFEKVGETAKDVLVIDDYAHHPTELRATLAAAREAYPDRRLIAVFQPHLPSRTRDFMPDFARSFGDADLVVLTDIYLAREKALEGVSGALLAEKVAEARGEERVRFVEDKADLPAALAEIAQPGDVVLTLGAGDIDKAGRKFLEISR
ncbi:MAG TPA: UDP-N-acetylmuramate--L-alanine ligase [Capsulimonadaceae bacterium]|nr:UDP-N-acetylmuramate--L-alanine ligase [Capsulimonadaceae bacterium]